MPFLNEKENLLLALDGQRPEWVPNFGKAAVWYESPAVARRPLPDGRTVDAFGVVFTSTIDGHMPDHTRDGVCRLEDITKWKEIMPQLDLDAIDWETEGKMAAQKGTAQYGTGAAEGEKVSNYVMGFLWDELHYLMGFENALMALVSEPEACYDFLQAAADFWIGAFRRQVRYFKPDMAMLIDHLSNANNMLMSPAIYREIIKPAQKKVFTAILDAGVRAEIHVDGYIEPILPDLAEMGVKIIQPFQIYNDIERAKKEHGMICIGGWDAFGDGNMETSTEEQVRQSVRTAMDLYAPSGRYVFYCSGATPKYPEHLRWLEDEAEIYGHRFYKD
ncbi:MAG: uroporphyrinogen decarboxylase family protein [Clostridia bacterium]|nr:uroporphyrinogen decarboxylase family protein [Clostridia bacterium]